METAWTETRLDGRRGGVPGAAAARSARRGAAWLFGGDEGSGEEGGGESDWGDRFFFSPRCRDDEVRVRRERERGCGNGGEIDRDFVSLRGGEGWGGGEREPGARPGEAHARRGLHHGRLFLFGRVCGQLGRLGWWSMGTGEGREWQRVRQNFEERKAE